MASFHTQKDSQSLRSQVQPIHLPTVGSNKCRGHKANRQGQSRVERAWKGTDCPATGHLLPVHFGATLAQDLCHRPQNWESLPEQSSLSNAGDRLVPSRHFRHPHIITRSGKLDTSDMAQHTVEIPRFTGDVAEAAEWV